jgi:hypothetical protein
VRNTAESTRASMSSRKRWTLGFQSWGNSSRKLVSLASALSLGWTPAGPARRRFGAFLAYPDTGSQRDLVTPENGSKKMGFGSKMAQFRVCAVKV